MGRRSPDRTAAACRCCRIATVWPISFRPVSTKSQIGLGGFLRALVNGPTNDIERRAMAEGSVGAGGAMLPMPLSAIVFDLLRSQSVAFKAGAQTVPMSSQTLRFATVATDPVGGWRAEAAAVAEEYPRFRQCHVDGAQLGAPGPRVP